MNKDFRKAIKLLHCLNISLRQNLEIAELVVPALNTQVSQLFSIGLISEQAMLGECVHQMAYGPGGPTDSGLVFQAVLRVPGGFGAMLLDSEEYAQGVQSQDGLEIFAPTKFVPFAECNPAIKAMILPQVSPLLNRLVRQTGAMPGLVHEA